MHVHLVGHTLMEVSLAEAVNYVINERRWHMLLDLKTSKYFN